MAMPVGTHPDISSLTKSWPDRSLRNGNRRVDRTVGAHGRPDGLELQRVRGAEERADVQLDADHPVGAERLRLDLHPGQGAGRASYNDVHQRSGLHRPGL